MSAQRYVIFVSSMKGINFLAERYLMHNEYGFISTTKVQNSYLFKASVRTFRRNLLVNFSTFHWLLKVSRSAVVESKNKTVEKRKDVETLVPDVLQSCDAKKKDLRKIKSLTVRPNINYNDMQFKIKQIQKFVDKGLTVALKVENPKNVEEPFEVIFSQIQKAITEQQIPARLTKSGLVINIFPVSTGTTTEDEKAVRQKKDSISSDIIKK